MDVRTPLTLATVYSPAPVSPAQKDVLSPADTHHSTRGLNQSTGSIRSARSALWHCATLLTGTVATLKRRKRPSGVAAAHPVGPTEENKEPRPSLEGQPWNKAQARSSP